jgi:hypothetical protein
MTIINYTSSVVNKLEALLTDDARVVIYDRHVFIVQATWRQKPEPNLLFYPPGALFTKPVKLEPTQVEHLLSTPL